MCWILGHDYTISKLDVLKRPVTHAQTSVMLNYAGEYGEYCDACQAAVTVIRSSDAALKSCLEWLTMSYILGHW